MEPDKSIGYPLLWAKFVMSEKVETAKHLAIAYKSKNEGGEEEVEGSKEGPG